jgi:hypothetical protein
LKEQLRRAKKDLLEMKGHKLAPFEQNLKSDLDSLENNFQTA